MTHSKGSHVEVEITYDPKLFRLRVRDYEHRVDPKILGDGGRPGHFGLQGMRERSERVGGQLKIWSGHETGTEIGLTVPGATAYRQADNNGGTRGFVGLPASMVSNFEESRQQVSSRAPSLSEVVRLSID